ncbi:LexA family transcriptional regulator [Aeromonas rivuli]|uniref:LexA family transcriptional regulator n=1 Tax=Aeromonas rivuli TaxID=648794 RepID=UPI0005A8A78E|nr:XRE family transcriptional regulator [Aeromonas rivuli]
MSDFKKNEDRFFLGDRKNRFSERLKIAMNGMSNSAFAKLCGVNESTIRSYLADKTTPTLTVLEDIAQASGVSFVWLASGKTPMNVNEGALQHRSSNEDTEKPRSRIPMYEIEVAAGAGAVTLEENIADYWEVPLSWLRQERLEHATLCIINATGDSMTPHINHGNRLLVKTNIDRDAALSGVYVINLDGFLRVKRLTATLFPAGYRITSDNELYPEEFIPADELDERLSIIGEVVRVMATSVPQPEERRGPVRGKTYSPSLELIA